MHVDISQTGGQSYGTATWTRSVLARALHADACRDYALVAWVLVFDLPAYPERYAAGDVQRVAYPLLADMLVGIRELLPPGLVRPGWMPEVVEIGSRG